MIILFWSSALLQAALIVIDEFYFHWKRGLPRWEKIGHPLDTFFFLLPLTIASFFKWEPVWRVLYIALGLLSCLVITKDEAIHLQKSPALEQWLHALLFMVHPVVLIAVYFVWMQSSVPLIWMWCAILTFCIYQIIFWNFYADRILKT